MSCRARMKQSYGLDKKQAAVKALERGENLTKVSHEFQVLNILSEQNYHTTRNVFFEELCLCWGKT